MNHQQQDSNPSPPIDAPTPAAAPPHQSQSSLHIIPWGGPHTRLPKAVESLLSWSLCLSCLSVSGYHYCVSTFWKPLWCRIGAFRGRGRLGLGSSIGGNDPRPDAAAVAATTTIPTWIPLMTHSQHEMESKSNRERYQQLLQYLSIVYPHLDHVVRREIVDVEIKQQLMDILKKDCLGRRLASLVMMNKWGDARSYHRRGVRCSNIIPTRDGYEMENMPLVRFLMDSWWKLLELPSTTMTLSRSSKNGFDISLVVPSYGETNELLREQMMKWYRACRDPSKVEVIVVDAGGSHVDDSKKHDYAEKDGPEGLRSSFQWGDVRILEYRDGGGRGPCLNFGAAFARGAILTFCHLDTTLPDAWDAKVRDVLIMGVEANVAQGEDASTMGERRTRANACAFGFGIDTSKEGLRGGPYPPGIRAVETTANIRTRLFALPYGDQALSLTRSVFEYLGGFPDQCLMEDYELVVLLRKRAALSKTSWLGKQEALKIVPGKPALCSPRRWQKFGVLYVTYMNSKFVNLYCGGLGPEQLYRLYYGVDPPKRKSDSSPWEEELEKILTDGTKS